LARSASAAAIRDAKQCWHLSEICCAAAVGGSRSDQRHQARSQGPAVLRRCMRGWAARDLGVGRGGEIIRHRLIRRGAGAHLRLNVHTPMGNEKQIPECRAQWERGMKSSRPSLSPGFPELPKACGTASPCGAGIVSRRKLLLQRQGEPKVGSRCCRKLESHQCPIGSCRRKPHPPRWV